MAKKRKAKKVKIKRKRAVQKTKRKKRSIRNQDVPVAAMSEREKEQNTQAQFLRDAFEGMKGRQPKSDQELNAWLATDEGKEATLFESASVSRWGETGRS